jgi:hypothetical protein
MLTNSVVDSLCRRDAGSQIDINIVGGASQHQANECPAALERLQPTTDMHDNFFFLADR